jgi:hypothetical protein
MHFGEDGGRSTTSFSARVLPSLRCCVRVSGADGCPSTKSAAKTIKNVKKTTMPKLNYRLLQVNGLRMGITEQGERPLILFCHGFPETAYSWRHQIAELTDEGYHSVAPDYAVSAERMRQPGQTNPPSDISSGTW